MVEKATLTHKREWHDPVIKKGDRKLQKNAIAIETLDKILKN